MLKNKIKNEWILLIPRFFMEKNVRVKVVIYIQLFAKPKFNEKVLQDFTIYCIIDVYYTTIANECVIYILHTFSL